jgi:hypothetical protein
MPLQWIIEYQQIVDVLHAQQITTLTATFSDIRIQHRENQEASTMNMREISDFNKKRKSWKE